MSAATGAARLRETLREYIEVGRNLSQTYSSIVMESIRRTRFRIENALMEALWSLLGLSRFIVPILRFFAIMWGLFLSSVLLYYAIYQYYLPRLLVEEPVHFNFELDAPLAKLNLLLPQDHSGDVFLSPSHYGKPIQKKFLRPGSIYDFTLKFAIAKSERNQEIGKFMSYINVFDKKDEMVAQASRPVVIPYHSRIALLADQLFRLPYYFFGLPEAEEIEIQVMKNYKEPYSESLATKAVEIKISRSDVDIMGCKLTIYPELSTFTYFLLHFPFVSFSVGVLVCFWGLFSTFLFYITVMFVIRFISNLVQEEEGPVVEGVDDVGSASTGPAAMASSVGSWSNMGFDPLSVETTQSLLPHLNEEEQFQRAVEESLRQADLNHRSDRWEISDFSTDNNHGDGAVPGGTDVHSQLEGLGAMNGEEGYVMSTVSSEMGTEHNDEYTDDGAAVIESKSEELDDGRLYISSVTNSLRHRKTER